MLRILLFIGCLFLFGQLLGQTRPFDGTFDEEEFEQQQQENEIPADSVDYDQYTEKGSSFKALFNGRPGKAIMYGLAIPGGGQIYNRRYWKFPLAVAAEGAVIYFFINLRSQHIVFRKAYALKLEDESYEFFGLSAEQINNYRKQYQKWTEQAGIGVIAIHLLVAIEAYIDRHLIDFDIDENLSLNLSPTVPGLANSGPNLSLVYRFGG